MESKEIRNWRDEQALKRLELITPLLDPDLDEAKKCQMREKIAEKNGITTRSLYRYEKYYRENAFEGLRPMNREMRRSSKLPDNYDEIVAQAIQLKREVPRRSVRQINRICEKALMYSGQQKKKLIDEHVVRYVAEHEMVGGGSK